MRPFKKHMLLGYAPSSPYQSLNSNDTEYELTIRVISWWGLIDMEIKHMVRVPHNMDARKFYEPQLNVWKT